MQFKVPQFLDIEDKLFGPFTFRQFIYLAGGAGTCFVLYRLLGFLWGSAPILFVAGLSAALTFYRPNKKPFIHMLEAGAKYFTQNKLYIWKHKKAKDMKSGAPEDESGPKAEIYGRRLTGEKLRDLAWSLDVLDLQKSRTSVESRK